MATRFYVRHSGCVALLEGYIGQRRERGLSCTACKTVLCSHDEDALHSSDPDAKGLHGQCSQCGGTAQAPVGPIRVDFKCVFAITKNSIESLLGHFRACPWCNKALPPEAKIECKAKNKDEGFYTLSDFKAMTNSPLMVRVY